MTRSYGIFSFQLIIHPLYKRIQKLAMTDMRFGAKKHKATVENDTDRTRLILEACGQKSLVLVGLMGAGKSAIGRRLAAQLEIPFVDADQEIEKAAGKTVKEIFADHGETYFRDGERRVIGRLLNEGAKVIATGGGAFMNPDLRAEIRRKGVSIWLKAGLDVLMQRVSRRDTRPLLNAENPGAVMEALMEQRYPIYATADITVVSRDAPHEVIVDEILESLAAGRGLHKG
jgi:shikimate kinase